MTRAPRTRPRRMPSSVRIPFPLSRRRTRTPWNGTQLRGRRNLFPERKRTSSPSNPLTDLHQEDLTRYTVVHSRSVAVLFVDTRPVDAILFHHDLLGADDPKSFFTVPG